MVELSTEEIKECSKESMRRHRETSLDVADEQDALVRLRRRFDLSHAWATPPIVWDQSLLHQILQAPCGDTRREPFP